MKYIVSFESSIVVEAENEDEAVEKAWKEREEHIYYDSPWVTVTEME